MTVEEKAMVILNLDNRVRENVDESWVIDCWLAEGPADGSTFESLVDDLTYEESWFDEWVKLANYLLDEHTN